LPNLYRASQALYRGTSLIRNGALLGPYSRIMHRAMRWALGGFAFL